MRGDVDQLGVDGEVREASAVGEQRLTGVAVRLVLPGIASSTVWPVSGFLSSAVKTGNPFRKSTMSRLFSFRVL